MRRPRILGTCHPRCHDEYSDDSVLTPSPFWTRLLSRGSHTGGRGGGPDLFEGKSPSVLQFTGCVEETSPSGPWRKSKRQVEMCKGNKREVKGVFRDGDNLLV